MSEISRYLNTANVLNWPVVLVVSGFILAANLGDTSLNGTDFVAERVVFVIAGQAFFFFSLWACDWTYIRHASVSRRWIVFLATVVTLSVLRGVLYTLLAAELGITAERQFGPRILGSITALTLLLLLATVIYGLVSEATTHRRQLIDIRERVRELRREGIRQREQNDEFVERTRAELARSLDPSRFDTPERTLSALQTSIDDVIRPLTLTLNRQAEVLERGISTHPEPVSWRRLLRETLDVRTLSTPLGISLFALLVLVPLSRVFVIIQALGVLAVLAATLWLSTSLLRLLVERWFRRAALWASPALLLVSGFIGVLVVRPVMPAWMLGQYELGLIAAYLFANFLGVIIQRAVQESREMTAVIAQANSELRWTLARANEMRLFNDRLISAALHGQAQAALSSAALRLQQALREGADIDRAMALAREQAQTVSQLEPAREAVATPIAASLEELAELWEGVCRIEWDAQNPELALIDTDPICARLCNELIVELCTNAIKHGKARVISVRLAEVGSNVFAITVTNDGKGLQRERAGFGSRLLAQSCLSWDESDTHGVTQVRVTVPFERSQPDSADR